MSYEPGHDVSGEGEQAIQLSFGLRLGDAGRIVDREADEAVGYLELPGQDRLGTAGLAHRQSPGDMLHSSCTPSRAQPSAGGGAERRTRRTGGTPLSDSPGSVKKVQGSPFGRRFSGK